MRLTVTQLRRLVREALNNVKPAPNPSPSCPECSGTGLYTGFNTVEPCQTCSTREAPAGSSSALAFRTLDDVVVDVVATYHDNADFTDHFNMIRDYLKQLGKSNDDFERLKTVLEKAYKATRAYEEADEAYYDSNDLDDVRDYEQTKDEALRNEESAHADVSRTFRSIVGRPIKPSQP